MTSRRLLGAVATGAIASALVFAGCGGSDDPAATSAAGAVESVASDAKSTASDVKSTATGAVADATTLTATCVGSDEACSVKIPLAGGASNRPVRVELTGTDFGDPTVTPSSPDLEGAFDIEDGEFTTGGSIYEFSLSAVGSIGDGGYITLDFASKQ
jgi:hypothetical protein